MRTPTSTSRPPSQRRSRHPRPRLRPWRRRAIPRIRRPTRRGNPRRLPPKSLPSRRCSGWASEAAAGIGLGARVGYTLPFHIYLGATFLYHLGESENGAHANFFYPGAEAGYELVFGSFVLRPYLGAGPEFLHLSDATQALTRTYPAAWLGGTAAYAITPNVFVGVDVRYLFGFSGYSMFGLFGTVGARF
jgi:hypothetical protein